MPSAISQPRPKKIRNCCNTICTAILMVFGSIVIFFAVSIFILGNLIPLVSLGYIGVQVTQFDVDFEKAMAAAEEDVQTKDMFIKAANFYENIWNFLLTGYDMGVIVWDMSLPSFLYLFSIFRNFMGWLFKFVFGTEVGRNYIMRPIQWSAQMAGVVVQAAVLASNSNMNTKEQPAMDPIEPSFGAAEEQDQDVTQFFVLLGNIAVKGSTIFVTSVENSAEAIDLFFNTILKYLAKFWKIMTMIAESMDPTKFMGKFFKNMMGLGSKLSFFSDASCFGRYFENFGKCFQDNVIWLFANKVCRGLKKLGYDGCKNKAKKCDFESMENPCKSKQTNDPSTGKDYKREGDIQYNAAKFDEEFGIGLCDEFQCTDDVIKIIDIFRSQNRSCSFWTANSATRFCLVSVRDYSIVNSSNIAEEDIETIGTELCFILRNRILQQCDAGNNPFDFDEEVVADEICVDDKSGESVPFKDSCACEFKHPMCEMSCCDQYSRHLSGQVVFQLQNRLCSEVLARFPETGVWCPFLQDTRGSLPLLSDYSYAHAMCNYYRKVVVPLCAIPTIRFGDLPIPSLLDNYVFDTCGRLDVEGVCIQPSSNISDITFELFSAYNELDIEAFFEFNNNREFFPAPIITERTATSTADEIITRTVEKFYCEQFSIHNNHSNPIFANQKWSIMNVIGFYCDTSVEEGLLLADVSSDIAYKTFAQDGTRLPSDLEGIPSDEPVFGSGLNMDNCLQYPGSNPDELHEQHVCSARLEEELGIYIDETVRQDDIGLTSMGASAVLADDMNHVSGLQSTDPSDPSYQRKMRELNTTTDVARFTTNYISVERQTLVNATRPFIQEEPRPVPDGDFDDQNPLHGVTHNTAPGGRVILSIDTPTRIGNPSIALPDEEEEEDDYYGTYFQNKARELLQSYGVWDGGFKERNNPESWRKKSRLELHSDKEDRKRHRAFHMILNRRVAHADASSSASYGTDELAFNKTFDPSAHRGRHLLAVGDDLLGTKAHAIVQLVQRLPPTPPGISEFGYKQHQNDLIAEQLQFMAIKIATVVIPNIFDMLYVLANNGTTSSFTFGSAVITDPVTGEPILDTEEKCVPTMSRPYECCTAETDPYECCKGLLGCIPRPPRQLFLDRTTAENLEKWQCKEFASWTAYFHTLLRLIFSGIVNTFLFGFKGTLRSILGFFLGWLTLENDQIPPNTGPCAIIKSYYLIFTVLGIWLLYYLLSAQILDRIVEMNVDNESLNEEDETEEAQAPLNAALDDSDDTFIDADDTFIDTADS